MATGYIGCVDDFDPDKEEWVNYKKRLEVWMVVNKIKAEEKANVLLSKVGATAFEVLVNLSAPDDILTKTYKQLTDLCEGHYKVVRTEEGERVNFRLCKQKPGQSISDFILELKKLSRYCNYTNVKEQLKEQFLSHLGNQFVRTKVMAECRGKDFEACCEKALTYEKIYQETHADKFTVGQVKMQKCYRCHGQHNPNFCHYKNATCYQCRGRGHIGRACSSQSRRGASTQNSTRGASSAASTAPGSNPGRGSTKPRGGNSSGTTNYRGRGRGRGHSGNRGGSKNNVNYVDENYDCVDDDLCESFQTLYSVESVNHVKNVPPEVEVTMQVEGSNINFVVDTAAPVSMIPNELYQQRFPNLKLIKDNLLLRSYTQSAIPVLGFLNVTVQYGEQVKQLPLYVVEGPACLLGRQWLNAIRLDWCRLFAVKHEGSLDELLTKYADVFSGTLGTVKDFKAEIQVRPEAKSIFHKPRNLPYALRDKVATQLDELEAKGVMTKITRSDWAAPLVVVPKQDGSLRLCGDYKVTVNQVIVPEPYPLPSAEDLFASLSNGKMFTKLDLSAAYQQVELTEQSKQYLVVNTHKGLYKLNRLSYGVSTAPNVFQRIMDQILQDIPDVVCYLDDILIASSEEEHLARVETVLARLQKYGIRVKKSKCEFFMNNVKYLGHSISAEGLKPTNEKIEAMQLMKSPEDLKELRVLLGFVNYYAKFIPNQASLLSPWYKLLQKNVKFVWNDKCEQVLDTVKKLLTDCKTLAHYDPSKPLTLACDASPEGVGCVLSHVFPEGERPIAYASRTLSSAEKNYCQLEKEGLAIVYGLRKFHKYLYGRRFTIITDNRPIARILGPKTGIPSLAALRLQRWALITMAYDYDLQTRRSQEHANCDALSRLPGGDDDLLASESAVNYFSYVENLPVTSKEISEETRNDPVLARAYDFTLNGWPKHCDDDALKPYFVRKDQLSVDGGCLLWGLRVVIPPKFRSRLLEELHADHPGVVKMKMNARSYFWYPSLDNDIEVFVSGCSSCQSMRSDSSKVPLIPWNYPGQVFERVHLDFADLKGQNYMMLVDSYSKWVEVVEMNTITTSQTIKTLRAIFGSFGLPQILVTDNGPQLVSHEFEHFLKMNGVRHIVSAPYHPATNGAAERVVQTVKSSLKKHLLRPNGQSMSQKLQSFLLTYRTTPHSTTGRPPAELFLKRQLRTRLSLLKPNLRSEVQNKQEIMKANHDKSVAKVLEFQVGEIVRVKNFRNGNEKYVKGVIAKKLGLYRYLVKIGNRCRYVHLEHLHKTGEIELDNENESNLKELLSSDSDTTKDRQSVSPSEIVPPSSPVNVSPSSTENSQVHTPKISRVPIPNPVTPVNSRVPIRSPVKSNVNDVPVSRHNLRRSVKPPSRLIEEV